MSGDEKDNDEDQEVKGVGLGRRVSRVHACLELASEVRIRQLNILRICHECQVPLRHTKPRAHTP